MKGRQFRLFSTKVATKISNRGFSIKWATKCRESLRPGKALAKHLNKSHLPPTHFLHTHTRQIGYGPIRGIGLEFIACVAAGGYGEDSCVDRPGAGDVER